MTSVNIKRVNFIQAYRKSLTFIVPEIREQSDILDIVHRKNLVFTFLVILCFEHLNVCFRSGHL